VLAVNAASPISSAAQLIDLARAKPGEDHLQLRQQRHHRSSRRRLLARAAGVPLTRIPYRGSAPAMNDLLGGQIAALMESLPTANRLFRHGGACGHWR
jgi:tripartite-type tricarboxylate transporter receptor subunit TctC